MIGGLDSSLIKNARNLFVTDYSSVFIPLSRYYCSRTSPISEYTIGMKYLCHGLYASGVKYLCHGPQPPLYKYAGLMENSHRDYDPEALDGIFFVKLSARMFSPKFSCTVYSPSRRGAWRLQTEPFDYRAAQHSGALVPRGGEWYSRSWTNLFGDLALICPVPPDTDLPNPISCHARLSWWPAHATFTWLDGGHGFQKISARPEEDTASEWISVPYDDTVFTAEMRNRYPGAFTAPVPVPLRPSEPAPGTEPSVATQVDNPPITVTAVKSTEPENSPSSEVTESDYDYAWWNHGWYGHDWSGGQEWNNHGWSGDHGEWHTVIAADWKANWADAPPDTPRKEVEEPAPRKQMSPTDPPVPSPQLSPIPSEAQSVTVTTSSPISSEVGTDAVVNTAVRVEQVTMTRTQSVEVTRLSETQTMVSLQRLALAGPPLTREDRLARQTLASRLTLAPEIYNLLVFGEDEEGHLPQQIADGPGTSSTPPDTANPPSP